jgi:formylglycine-generating enzyme required for sulfatase activity
MTPADDLVALLVAGIKATQNQVAHPLLAKTYIHLKTVLCGCYPTLDLQALERRPDAPGKQLALAEDLTELAVMQNLACLTAFILLAQHLLAETTAMTVIGVDLDKIKAAELKIREIQSGGLGVRVREAAIDQTIEIDTVNADAPTQSTTGSNGGGIVLTGVTAGRDIIINSLVDPHAAHIATLRIAYLSRLFRRADTIFLSHVSPQSQVAARISLKAVYTAQLTHTLVPMPDGAGPRAGRPAKRLSAVQERRLTAVECLNTYQHLVLLGAPGSGKSSFLKFIALCMAGAILRHPEANLTFLTTVIPTATTATATEPPAPQPEAPWALGSLLPVYIPLRELVATGVFADHEQGSAEKLLTYITQELRRVNHAEYAPYLEQELRESGGLLLLDGLDEVADGANQRRQICQAIAEFGALYPRCRIVLSSRPYAYQDPAWQLPGFTEVILAPFDDWQIERFVDTYYAHLLHAQGAATLNNSQAQADRFKAEIKANVYLRELATTPLLLTLMVSLFTWQGGALPDNNDELYAQGVDLLLNEWERPKLEPTDDGNAQVLALSVHEWLQAPRQKIRQALEELAFQAHAKQTTLETAARIHESAIVEALLRAAGRDARPGRLTEYIQNRAGLLIDHGDGWHSFPHRTIQEYLAACYLTRTNLLKQLAGLVRADPQRWREVLLLAGGKVGRNSPFTVWALIDRLCPLPCTNPTTAAESDWWMALLAGRLLVSMELYRAEALDQSEMQTLDTVKGWLLALIDTHQLPASDRALAGADLGILGDPRPGVGLTAVGLPDLDWIPIPAGPFLMGTPPLPCDWITAPYRISRYPITQAQYGAFIKAGGYAERSYWTAAGWQWREAQAQPGPALYPTLRASPNQPQVGICWYEALAFCHWLTAATGETIGLPSEAQWERSARHTDGRLYPWGNHFGVPSAPDQEGQTTGQKQRGNPSAAAPCNMRQSGIAQPSPVGLFPTGDAVCGAVDLAGNVWEWCATPWRKSYTASAPGVDHGLEGAVRRVLRGGSWANEQHLVRCAHRHRNHPDHRGPNVGFRVVAMNTESTTRPAAW